uniref:Family with sequence similarity 170 member A n=1 Tax=Sus scrofa TaxID=9823 RepID=A0A8D0N5F1_PIG
WGALLKRKGEEVCIYVILTPEDTSQPESYVEVPVCSQTPGEKSSDSEYFSCVSSPCKLIFADEDGIHPMHQDDSYLRSPEKPLPQDLEQWETSSPFPQVSFPFNLVNSNESFVSSIFMKKKRVMKIYYMHVQMKKGVAILWETEKGLEPPSKKIKIEEMTYPEKIHMAFTLPHMSTKEFLTDSEFSWDSKVQEEREETDSPAEPTVLEECSRAKTPEWLVALDSGFRCMGCCRVFPSLDILQEHVEHGVKEGFSCHAFHIALAWLKSKGSKKGKKKRRKKTKIKKTTSGPNQHFRRVKKVRTRCPENPIPSRFIPWTAFLPRGTGQDRDRLSLLEEGLVCRPVIVLTFLWV